MKLDELEFVLSNSSWKYAYVGDWCVWKRTGGPTSDAHPTEVGNFDIAPRGPDQAAERHMKWKNVDSIGAQAIIYHLLEEANRGAKRGTGKPT